MRILLVSEGAHELGAWDPWGKPVGPSALENFCRRLLSHDAEFVRMKVSDPAVRTHGSAGRAGGYERRVWMWLNRAEREGFDALVLVIDQDNPDERRQEQLDRAQEDARFPIRRALGVAIRTFDAWMLADEQALSTAAGYRVPRQRDPERASDPKSICRQLREAGTRTEGPTSDFYALLAEQVELGLVEQRCPRGFRPFAERVRKL